MTWFKKAGSAQKRRGIKPRRKAQKRQQVKGLAEKLKTNPDKGIHEDEANILDRKNVFGSNTYPRKKGRSFWRLLLDACRDTTLIILMVAAAASLALGIKTEGGSCSTNATVC